MNKFWILAPLGVLLTGCGSAPEPTPVSTQVDTPPAPAVKLTAAQELAKYCRVCVVDKGEKMEEYLPSRLDKTSGGHAYKFCSDPCRKKFDATPAKYVLKGSPKK